MGNLSIHYGTILLAATVIVASGCGNPFEAETEGLKAHVAPPVLVLDNQGPATIYTLVVERNAMALINYAPCVDPARCDGLAPGTSKSLPLADVVGYLPGAREILVLYWELRPKRDGGFQQVNSGTLVLAIPQA